MGLDQYAYVVKKTKSLQDIYDNDAKTRPFIVNNDFAYWRKNYELHDWMFELAKKKGFKGSNRDFNCVMVRLGKRDIQNLIKSIKSREFNEERYYDHEVFDMNTEKDLNFCGQALRMLEEGFAVYYDSWW